MALKDWKKKLLRDYDSKDKYWIKFVNKDKRRSININRIKDKYFLEFNWGVHIHKSFKTKQQALKFAKDYMRKH